MADTSVPNVEVDERTKIGLSLIAILAGTIAAYYAGQTGDPHPLF